MGATSRFSRRTWTVLALGVAASLIVQVLVVAQAGGETVSTALSDIGGVLIIGTAAVVTIRTALSFGKGEPLRRQWLAIGVGILFYTLGDVLWTYIEVIRGAEVPFPGVPDVFYVSMYAFLGFGILSAAIAYRGLVRIKTPVVAATVISVASGIALYFVLIKDIIGDPAVGLLEKALDIYYPLADLALLFGPAVFIVLVVSQLGRGLLATPWRFVMAGMAILAVADTVYQWLEWQGMYAAGNIVDFGWMFGYVLIAVGASVMRDLILPDTSQRG